MKYFIIAFFVMLNFFHLQAQQSTFRVNYNIAMTDLPGNIIQLDDGSYVFAGTNATFIPIYGTITKTDINGNLIWSKGIQSSIATEILNIIEVSPALGGGFLLCGNTNPGAILIRLDNNANLIWARRYQLPDLSGKASLESASAVKQTSDNNFIVAGSVKYFWDGTSPATADTTMPLAFKVDATGNMLWSRVYEITVPNPDEHFFTDVTETADGYFFVGASSRGEGTLNSNGDYYRDGLIIKTDLNGNLSYARKFGASTRSEYVNSIITLSSGNVLMSGSRGDNGYLLRINGTGGTPSINYGYRYSRTFGTIEYGSLVEMPDGHYGALGFTSLLFDLSVSSSKFNNGSGDVIFNKNYLSGLSNFLPMGGLAIDTGFYMIMTAQQMTGFNYHIVKTDKNGEMNNPDCPEGSFTASKNGYTPGLDVITPTIHQNMLTTSTFTPSIVNLNPTVTVDCKNIVCIPPPPPLPTATPATGICVGQSATLSASGSGANVTYHYFTDTTQTSFATGNSVVVTPGLTTTYWVAAEDDNNLGCFSFYRAVTVVVHPLPTITFTNNSPVCTGTTLEIQASGGTNYTWQGPDSFTHSGANVSIPSATNDNAGTYTVTVTDDNGCVNTNSTTITVVPQPTASASGDSPICEGGSSTLTAIGLPGSNYTWSHGAGNTNIVSVSPLTTTTYTVSVVDDNNCGTATATVVVQVIPFPIVTTAPDTICKGAVYNVVASASNYDSLAWSTSGTGSFNDYALLNPVYTPSQIDNDNGSVMLTLTVYGQAPCTQITSQIPLALVEPAAPIITNADTALCMNAAPFLLTAVPSGGTFSGTGISTGTFTPSAAGAGMHTFTYTVSDAHGCQNSVTDSIEVYPLATANAGNDQTICERDSATLFATGLPNSIYVWSTGDTAQGIIVTPMVTTTYTVSVTDENNCSTATDQVIIHVITPPAITTENDTICQGDVFHASAVVSNHVSVLWSTGGDGSFGNPQSLTPVYTPGQNDISNNGVVLTITASGLSPCGEETGNIYLYIADLPQVELNADSLMSLCADAQPYPLSGGTPIGGTYSGSFVSNNIFNPQTAGAGVHNVTYTYTDALGCTNYAINTIEVVPLPQVSLLPFANVCITDEIVQITGGQPNGGIYSGDYVINNEFDPSLAGVGSHLINYTYTDANGCTNTASTNILVVPEVELLSDAPDNTIYVSLGSIVNFTTIPANSGTYDYYIDNNLQQSSTNAGFATNLLDGTNTVYIVLNEACSDSLKINVKPVPNAFVPFTLDGSNDVFMPYVDLTIINRWGQELYRGTDGWDGKYKGQNVSPGTYFYIINVQGLNGQDKQLTGTVTLVNN